MTTWGFISDVHGNLPALRHAIALCRRHGAEQFVFLGDLLGRGDSDACVRLIRETATFSVVGNRDLDWADRVGDESREYVLGLPRIVEASSFVAVHGDARLVPELSSAEIRRDFRRAYLWLRGRSKRLLFFGHTHHARTWHKLGVDAGAVLLPSSVTAVPTVDDAVLFVNVGTTGLPFPGKGPPSCAVYDEVSGTIAHLVLGAGRGRPLDRGGIQNRSR